MRRRSVDRILLCYFAVLWAAVIFRIDRFPLTWAPMYSVYKGKQIVSVRRVDKEQMKQGLVATHRDGTRSRVSWRDLNIPKWNFWRLYYQRAFGGNPNTFKTGNAGLGAMNRWIRGLEPREPNFSADWTWRILRSVNGALGHRPGDPRFIVRLEADLERIHFQRDDLSRFEREQSHAVLEWRDGWEDRRTDADR